MLVFGTDSSLITYMQVCGKVFRLPLLSSTDKSDEIREFGS